MFKNAAVFQKAQWQDQKQLQIYVSITTVSITQLIVFMIIS